MHKKAYEHIWRPFLQFSTDFNETLSKCFFFQGSLNETFKSELTLLFFIVSKGDQRKKTQKPKKQKKVQPNVLIGLFVHFPFSIPILFISGWRIIILCSKFLGACLFNSLFIRQPNIDVQNLQWSVRGLLLLQPIVESRTQRGQIRFTIYSILCSLNRYFFKDSRHQNYKKKWFFFLSFSEF